ncbi:MAG TPA: hypothetical protein VK915_12935 [Gaiellaceae bacterium]|nr:hypothetical protein [Gaiellaceae bacterium]
MAAWKVILVAYKAHRGWRRIPPAQRRALVRAASERAKTHGPAVAKTVREQGPDVARRLADAYRRSRKAP